MLVMMMKADASWEADDKWYTFSRHNNLYE